MRKRFELILADYKLQETLQDNSDQPISDIVASHPDEMASTLEKASGYKHPMVCMDCAKGLAKSMLRICSGQDGMEWKGRLD